MNLYFSKPEQLAVGVLLAAILGAIVTLSYVYGGKLERARQEAQQDNTGFHPAVQTHPVPISTLHQAAPAPAPTPPPAQIVVHVSGAVRNPGVYHLTEGTRIEDAVKAAGGASRQGVPDALNLAAKLLDGEKIIVPTKAEVKRREELAAAPPLTQKDTHTAPSDGVVSISTAESNDKEKPGNHTVTGPKQLPTQPISINSATAEELHQLPGIGVAMAQRIIDYRTQHGKFNDISELQNIPGIGVKTLEKLKPYVKL